MLVHWLPVPPPPVGGDEDVAADGAGVDEVVQVADAAGRGVGGAEGQGLGVGAVEGRRVADDLPGPALRSRSGRPAQRSS